MQLYYQWGSALICFARTRSYIKAAVAAELGIQRSKEKIPVCVLNSKKDGVETKPVGIEGDIERYVY